MALRTLDGFEIFPWNHNFETGISQIDAQHRQLVIILNKLAFFLGHRADEVDLDSVFDELASYAKYHFSSEEEIWQQYLKDDISVKTHQQTHSSFVSDVLKLKADKKSSIDVVIENILKFLSRWLAIHILNVDARMAKTVLALNSGLSLEQAKEQAAEEMSGEKAVLIEAILQMYEQLSSRTLALMRERAERLSIPEKSSLFVSPEVCLTLDESLKLRTWNSQFAEQIGLSLKQLVTATLNDFVKEDEFGRIEKSVMSAFESGKGGFDCTVVGGGIEVQFKFTCETLVAKGERTLLILGTKL